MLRFHWLSSQNNQQAQQQVNRNNQEEKDDKEKEKEAEREEDKAEADDKEDGIKWVFYASFAHLLSLWHYAATTGLVCLRFSLNGEGTVI